MRRPLLLPVLLLLGAASIGRAGADHLLVFAAASTGDAVEQVARQFHEATGHTVELSTGSSSLLARQIAAGAPADLFLSADSAKMDQLEREGRVARGSRRDLLSNRLVVIVPLGGGRAIARPSDLLEVGRLAIADPASVPAGIYAREWLESNLLWKQLQPRIVPTLDVRAALAAVEARRVDAGIVYATDAKISTKVRLCYTVPEGSGPRIVYPVAPIALSRHAAAAAELMRFLASEPARATFRRFGFVVL